MSCLLVWRVVVEFEQVWALAVDAFVVVSLKNDPFLAGCRVAPSVCCVDRLAFHVVQQHADERLVQALTHGTVRNRCAVIERRPVTSHMDDGLSGQLNVLAQEQQNERISPLLRQRRHTRSSTVSWARRCV